MQRRPLPAPLVSSRALFVFGAVCFTLWAFPAAHAVDQDPAPFAGKTPDNHATARMGEWGLTGTDMTVKEDTGELWIVSGHSVPPFARTFQMDDLEAVPGRVELTLPEEFQEAPILGIAEIPHGPFRGNNFVLIDPQFAEGPSGTPVLGILDDSGMPLEDAIFATIEGLPEEVSLSAIDVHPTRDELAAYDAVRHAIIRIDFSYTVIGEPLLLLGGANTFGAGRWFFSSAQARGAGMGVAYDGPDHIFAASSFVNRFETHLVLRYELASGDYSGTAIDLSDLGTSEQRDRVFVGADTWMRAEEGTTLFAHNFADDAVYAFQAVEQSHGAPVGNLSCTVLEETGQYDLRWDTPTAPIDSIIIVENGVEIEALDAAATRYTSRFPLLGKAFIEVASVLNGETSSIRPLCQVENSRRPRLDGVRFGSVQIANLSPLAGIAVTPRPQSPEEFRCYVVGLDSNTVGVFDYRLDFVESLALQPPALRLGDNLAVLGISLVERNGSQHLALLDPDGETDNNSEPTAAFYALEGHDRGFRSGDPVPIEFPGDEPQPFLFDWDADDDNHFVAGGILPDGRYVVVRILADGDRLVATQVVPAPQFALQEVPRPKPIAGIGVSVLPNGNLLVAGSDSFSNTYTEALLITPFCDDPPNCDPDGALRLVGYAQGLFATNQFLPQVGPLLGPRQIFACDTSYIALENEGGLGVSYLPTGDTVLIRNPSLEVGLKTSINDLLIHGETPVAHPNLVAEALREEIKALAPDEALEFTADAVATRAAQHRDYYVYVLNAATPVDATVQIEVRFGAELVDLEQVTLAPGRYFRRHYPARAENAIRLSARNVGPTSFRLKVLAGVTGIAEAGPTSARFLRGDCDSNGSVQLTDALVGLNWLFLRGDRPSCLDACDSDDGGNVNLTDLVLTLNYLFLSGPEPAPPGATRCGVDVRPDELPSCIAPASACPAAPE